MANAPLWCKTIGKENLTMDTMLRKALWGFLRPLVQLITNLLSPEVGEEWERELKRFLRKEPCWTDCYAAQVAQPKPKLSIPEFVSIAIVGVPKCELYLAPGQQGGKQMKGIDLEEHLQKKNLISRVCGLDDRLIKEWIANPETYPEEFKSKDVFLWKVPQVRAGGYFIPYLYWNNGRVMWDCDWIGNIWDDDRPALLAITKS